MDLLSNVLFGQIAVGIAFILSLIISVKNPLKLKGSLQGIYYVILASILIGYLSGSWGTAILFGGIALIIITVLAVVHGDFDKTVSGKKD